MRSRPRIFVLPSAKSAAGLPSFFSNLRTVYCAPRSHSTSVAQYPTRFFAQRFRWSGGLNAPAACSLWADRGKSRNTNSRRKRSSMAASNDQAALNLAFTILLGSGIRSNANGGSVGRGLRTNRLVAIGPRNRQSTDRPSQMKVSAPTQAGFRESASARGDVVDHLRHRNRLVRSLCVLRDSSRKKTPRQHQRDVGTMAT